MTVRDAVRPAADRATLGAVYTPTELARWTASLITQAAAASDDAPIRTAVDPACGDGELLDAARAELPTVEHLVGFDRSKVAAATARNRLARTHLARTRPARTSPDNSGPNTHVTSMIRTRDTLTTGRPPANNERTAIIMNPPWGADVAGQTARLRQLGYQLAAGQFDSWDLFVEWSLRAETGTVVAAILPDSLFQPEHTDTRRLLLTGSTLNVVARLGEGWFDGVFRGVVVLVYTVGEPTDTPVRTIRIDYAARRRILRGQSTLADEAAVVGHDVPPGPWIADPMANFHVTTAAFHASWTATVEARGGAWTDWFTVGRGVEMGARGELFRCKSCGWHRGPSRDELPCPNCAASGPWTAVQAITDESAADAVPLIVGRDVCRHRVAPSRWLRLGLAGVSYKDPDVYRQPKLLVRKTGLGFNVAVDRSGSYTNQVVFHYLPHATAPSWALHYTEGLLCSRVMLAFHLARTGETEWRSHPYVTPKVLATLPIPAPTAPTDVAQAKAISTAVAGLYTTTGAARTRRLQRVDELVAGLFGLDEEQCAMIDAALEHTQTLAAFEHLRDAAPLKPLLAGTGNRRSVA